MVIGIIALLAAILLPALGNAKSRAQAVLCLNNERQLIIAWTTYASDNQDWAAPNGDGGSTVIEESSYPNAGTYGMWLGGDMSGRFWNTDPTNFGLLNNSFQVPWTPPVGGFRYPVSAIGNYIGSYKICRCPADKSGYGSGGVDALGQTPSLDWGPRVRSYCMSSAVGTLYDARAAVAGIWLNAPGGVGAGDNKPGNPYNTYGKLSAFDNPGPANTFVIADTDPYSIETPTLFTDMALPDCMVDWPASYHGRAGSFAFADGHSIIKHWADPRTYSINTTEAVAIPVQAGNPDIEWLRLKSSAYGDGSPLPLSVPPSP